MFKRPKGSFKKRLTVLILYTILVATIMFFAFDENVNRIEFGVIMGALLLLYPVVTLIFQRLKRDWINEIL